MNPQPVHRFKTEAQAAVQPTHSRTCPHAANFHHAGVRRISIIDSHTGGEPTRVVVVGGPDLGHGPLPERRERFQRDFDHRRSTIVNKPRTAMTRRNTIWKWCPPHTRRFDRIENGGLAACRT